MVALKPPLDLCVSFLYANESVEMTMRTRELYIMQSKGYLCLPDVCLVSLKKKKKTKTIMSM